MNLEFIKDQFIIKLIILFYLSNYLVAFNSIINRNSIIILSFFLNFNIKN